MPGRLAKYYSAVLPSCAYLLCLNIFVTSVTKFQLSSPLRKKFNEWTAFNNSIMVLVQIIQRLCSPWGILIWEMTYFIVIKWSIKSYASRTGLRNRCNKYQSKTACMLLLGGGFLSCSSDKLSLCIGAWGTNFSFLSHKVRAKSKTLPLWSIVIGGGLPCLLLFSC